MSLSFNSFRGYALFAILAAFFPAWAVAAEVAVRSDTLVRVTERDTLTEEGLMVIPAYEYLRLDAGVLSEKGVSFHLYAWGRVDAGDGGFYEDDTEGELLYAYLEYARPETNVDIRLGRQYVFEGLPGDSVDGLRVKGDITPYLTFSLYGGLPVSVDSEEGRDGDILYGGRIAHHLGSHYEIGISYKKLENNDIDEEEKIAFDLSLALPWGVTLDGFSSRDRLTDEWAEHAYEMGFRMGDFLLRPSYTVIDYGAFFNRGTTGVRPFSILAAGGDEVSVLGGDLLWRAGGGFELGGRLKSYDYDLSNDSASYGALLATWHGNGLSQVGGEAGSMEGDRALTDYVLGRLFFFWEHPPLLKKGFVSGDVVYVSYEESIYGEDSSFFASLGAGNGFLNDRLRVKLSGDYSSDPYFDEDVRGTLTVEVVF